MDEKVIIDDIKNGDQQQLALLYRTYRSEFIAWLISQYRCDREDARDIYQVSILTLHQNILEEKLQSLSSNLKTYLFAIGKNKFREFRRAENKIDRSTTPEQLALVNGLDSDDRENKLQIMEQSLEDLGDPCRTLLELYYFHGMSMEEIADKVGYKNRDTAKNLKCKCIVRLRKIFGEAMRATSEQLNAVPNL